MNYTLNLIDPQYGQSQFGKNILSILGNRDGYSFSVADTAAKSILRLTEITISDQNNFSQDSSAYEFFDLLNENFEKKFIIYYPQAFTLVPEAYYNDKKAEDWLGFNCIIPSDHKVIVNELPGIGARIITSISDTDYNKLDSLIPGAEFVPVISILINCFKQYVQNKESDSIMIYTADSKAVIVVFRGKELLLVNTFETADSDDLLYFIIYIIEQLGLIPQPDFLYLSGDIVLNDFKVNKLKNFFSNDQFIDSLAEIPDALGITPVTASRFLPLFQAVLCEL